MVYIHFPTNYTEEELMLQTKYQKLKKKKRALQAHKAPKQEPEKPIVTKRPSDARDAREVARKLIKSGAIPAIQKSQAKQDQVFKRPKGQDRKRTASECTVATYQPFSSTQNDVAQETIIGEMYKEEPRTPNLYQHFESGEDTTTRKLTGGSSGTSTSNPVEKSKGGNTIFVSGNKLTEEFLKKTFCEVGTIVNISMEIEKGHGFVTFAKQECADRSIVEFHNKVVSGINIQVQLARRQPLVDPINEASSSAVWSSIAASKSQKGSHHKDHREMVQYDEDFLL